MPTCSACKKETDTVTPNPEYKDELLCPSCLAEEHEAQEAWLQQLDFEAGYYGYEPDFFRE